MRANGLLAVCAILATVSQRADANILEALAGKNIAITAYSLTPQTEPYVEMVRSRLERILEDNGYRVLDEQKSREMQDGMALLEDPTYVLTAQDILDAARKYRIDAILRVYFSGETTPGLSDYITATAQMDLRLVNVDAETLSETSHPMGSFGHPPSDGLNKHSALNNAIRRAIDQASERIGLHVLSPTDPGWIQLRVSGPVRWDGPLPQAAPRRQGPDPGPYAQLQRERWTFDEITKAALDPSSQLGAVALHKSETSMAGGRMIRSYSSEIRLIDMEGRREFKAIPCHPMGRGARGTREILDCVFVGNWRYLAAVSGMTFFFWDVERSERHSELELPSPIKRAELIHDGNSIFLRTDVGNYKFTITR